MVLSNKAHPEEYSKFKESVLRGEIPVNRPISLEMNRIDFLIQSPDYYYDDQAIQGFIRFCENEMTLTDGSDVTLLPSFRLWAECALAWFYKSEDKVFNPERGRWELKTRLKRLVNKQYLIVGRGAAKSLYATYMHAYMLLIDPATTQQVVTAPTMKQAEETMMPFVTAISRAKGPLIQFMTKGSKMTGNLNQKQLLSSTKKGVENFATNSIMMIRPMSIDKLQGLRCKYATVDEWLSGDVKEDVVGALEQSASKNPNWLIIATSSEGTARDGVGDTIKMELMDILEGRYFNPHVSIWYYRLDDVKEVAYPETWLKANPNLGATVSYETYQQEVERAEMQPATRSDTLAKRFGIPVEGHTYFFVYEETRPHRPQDFDGMECAMGADLSQGDDFCAFTFLFPLGRGRFGVKTRSYVSESKLKKLNTAMRNKYDELINEGTLIVIPGVLLEMDRIYDDLEEFIYSHRYSVSAFGYDPYNARDFVQRWVRSNGEYGVEKVIQGAKTESVPMGEIKNLARERMLIFDEEMMKFAMGNAVAIQDNNGNYKLSKRRQDEKIDNVAALIDAWVAYSRNRDLFD